MQEKLSSETQTDPRLPPDVRQGVLADMQIGRCRAGFEGARVRVGLCEESRSGVGKMH